MKKTLLILILIIVGCNSPRQKQVSLTELQDAHNADVSNVVRVYIDKQGNLYPKSDFYIPYKSFFKERKYKNSYKLECDTGALKYYFLDSIFEAKKLAESYNISKDQTAEAIFEQVQIKIQDEKTNQIKSLIKASKDKTLLIFIHGFNDPNPSGDYQRMRNYIKKYKSNNDFVYLEIYWDGLTSNQGNPGTSKIWGFAQLNSSYVANSVRHLINRLELDTKIRVLTHSLGASVGTGALFNTFSKWKNPENFDYYDDMMSTLAPTQKDIRIGMIAPAIPGVLTFKDFNERRDIKTKPNNTIHPNENNINKVIIGYKDTDYALIKGFFKKSKYLSKKFGATTLGANPETNGISEIDSVYSTMKNLGYTNANIPIDTVNFKEKTHFDKEHGLYYYMQNHKSLKLFLDKLLD